MLLAARHIHIAVAALQIAFEQPFRNQLCVPGMLQPVCVTACNQACIKCFSHEGNSALTVFLEVAEMRRPKESCVSMHNQ